MSEVATLLQEGNQIAREKNWEEALECYRAASALDPTNPEVWFLVGCCHFKLNHGTGAREAWERSLAIDPTYEKARVWIHRVTGLSGRVPLTSGV